MRARGGAVHERCVAGMWGAMQPLRLQWGDGRQVPFRSGESGLRRPPPLLGARPRSQRFGGARSSWRAPIPKFAASASAGRPARGRVLLRGGTSKP